ncbi:hypothetical protein NECID01_0757 [Nematocida sp. AWRm77]|nr:hypothetical protein NECID01_0757 [Nematocida sp. AWRm77]
MSTAFCPYREMEAYIGETGSVITATSVSFLLCLLGICIPYRYILRPLDFLCKKWKKDTIGTKSLILSFLLGSFPFWDFKFAEETPNDKIFKTVIDGSSFVCISLIAGLAVVLKKERERNVKECMQQCLFFLSGSMFIIPWMHANKHMKTCGVFLLMMYTSHVTGLSVKGKVFEPSSSDLSGFEKLKLHGAARVLDFFMGVKEDFYASSTISLFASSFLLGSAGCLAVSSLSLNILAIITALSLCMSCALKIGSKAGTYRRSLYLVVCCISWLKLFSLHLGTALAYLIQHKAQLITSDKGRLLDIGKACFPILCTTIALVQQNRYRLCMIFVLNCTLHHTLYTNGLLYLTRESTAAVYTEHSVQSAIFLMISTILLFFNSEMRSGMLETEIGCILIFLFSIFIFHYIFFVVDYL